MMFINKKGQGVSMTYIVIAALALIVLVVIVLFFTGGMENLFEKIKGTTEGAGGEKTVWISQCKIYCSSGQIEVFNSAEFGDGETCSSLGVECEESEEEEVSTSISFEEFDALDPETKRITIL